MSPRQPHRPDSIAPPDPTTARRLGHVAGLMTLACALASCGGGGGAGGVTPAARGPNTVPVADFAVPAGAVAGEPVVFDAGASQDGDGDPLAVRWDFGDGQPGGGTRIAHVFLEARRHTVRLTVDDGFGGRHQVEKDVDVASGAVALSAVKTRVRVRDVDGTRLAGVQVRNVDGSPPATTDANGEADVDTARGVPATLRFSKAGLVDQIKRLTLPAGAEGGYLEATLMAAEPAQTLADAAAGGTLAGRDGARVTLPAGALVDEAGQPVSGAVQVAMTPADVAARPRSFPGQFAGMRTDGTSGPIASYGAVEYTLRQGAQRLQLAPGAKAVIEIPVYATIRPDGTRLAVGDTFPMWSLDERTGVWTEEGTGTVVASVATPSGFALRGEVAHFSWWNHDQFINPTAKPKPRCLVDTNLDGVLEDLTGTGYCWHYGTGPEQPDNSGRPPAVSGGGFERPMAEPRTQRFPTYTADAITPASGGEVLVIPANMDITFHSFAKNGTLQGTKVVNLGPNVEQDVDILLEPVEDVPGARTVTLPHGARYAVATAGEVDLIRFDATAGQSYEIHVRRSTASLLTGTVQLRDAGGTALRSGNLELGGFSTQWQAAVGSTLTVAVTAGLNAPGAYEIEIRTVAAGSCGSPTALTLGVPRDGVAVSSAALNCFSVVIAAERAIELRNTQNLNARGSVTVLAPDGQQIAADGYGNGVFDGMFLRFGTAQAGTYLVQVENTAGGIGTLNGFVVGELPLAGVLDVPGTTSHVDVADTTQAERHYLARTAGATPLGVVVQGHGIDQGFQVFPGGINATSRTVAARVVAPPLSAYPVVTVNRASLAAGWNFTLALGEAEALAKNTTHALVTPPVGEVRLYVIDGVAGQELSIGRSVPDGANLGAGVALYPPVPGNPLTPRNQVYTLANTGPHGLVVTGLSAPLEPFSLRVGDVAEATPIVPTAAFELAGDLALGEVRRWSFLATQAQVVAMQLANAPGSLHVAAVLQGPGNLSGVVQLNGAGTASQSVYSGPVYVPQTGLLTLQVAATGTVDGHATGPYALQLQVPAAVPSAVGALLPLTLEPQRLVTHSYTLGAAGKYLLCHSYGGPLDAQGFTQLDARIWGPSAPFSNYTGDIQAGDRNTFAEGIGDLRAGLNTLGVHSRMSTPTPAFARLVALREPGALTPDGAAVDDALAPCERRYLLFTGTAGASYHLVASSQFAGTLRVHKLAPNGNWSARSDPPFGTLNVIGPTAMAAGGQLSVDFTVNAAAPFGAGSYVVEIDADEDASGAFHVEITSN